MELIENTEFTSNFIASIDETSVVINDKTIKESCIISNNTIITELNISSIDALKNTHIDQLLSSDPEIIILGTGIKQDFPDTSILTPIAHNNIGFEVMNNLSSSRTYNVLLNENRKVACLLLFNN
jgi:uncharacterized protein